MLRAVNLDACSVGSKETAIKLDQKTAEALLRLSHNTDFQQFAEWLEVVHITFTQGAIMGVDGQDPTVLRGRAQGISIVKMEMEKAPDVAGRIQKIS